MLVNSQYVSDLGSVSYYAPLNFKQLNNNGQTVTFFEYRDILPDIIVSQVKDVDYVCQINKNIIQRLLIINAVDNNIYSCVNGIQPYTENFFTLIEQLKQSDKVYTFRLLGEKIRAYYLPFILERNA